MERGRMNPQTAIRLEGNTLKGEGRALASHHGRTVCALNGCAVRPFVMSRRYTLWFGRAIRS